MSDNLILKSREKEEKILLEDNKELINAIIQNIEESLITLIYSTNQREGLEYFSFNINLEEKLKNSYNDYIRVYFNNFNFKHFISTKLTSVEIDKYNIEKDHFFKINIDFKNWIIFINCFIKNTDKKLTENDKLILNSRIEKSKMFLEKNFFKYKNNIDLFDKSLENLLFFIIKYNKNYSSYETIEINFDPNFDKNFLLNLLIVSDNKINDLIDKKLTISEKNKYKIKNCNLYYKINYFNISSLKSFDSKSNFNLILKIDYDIKNEKICVIM